MKIEKDISVGKSSEYTLTIDQDYRKWLLNGGKGNPPSTPPEDERKAAEDWYKRCLELMDDAKSLARSGVPRGGIEFDAMKNRAKALAAECRFKGSERGLVVTRAVAAYDNEMASLEKGGGEDDGDLRAVTMKPGMSDGSEPSGKVDSTETCKSGEWQHYIEPADRGEATLLRDIQRLAGWDGVPDAELNRACDDFRSRYSFDAALMQMACENGRLIKELKAEAYKMGWRSDDDGEVRSLIASVAMPGLFDHIILKSFQSGVAARKRNADAAKLRRRSKKKVRSRGMEAATPAVALPGLAPKASGADLPASSCAHPNSILALRPSCRWTIVADETGSAFGNEAFNGGDQSGKYVFVMIPSQAALPRLPRGWHAVEQELAEIVKTARTLHDSGCGILGVPVRDLYMANVELWEACIETLLDIVLRLLPIDGETEIDLNVEQRGNASDANRFLLDKTVNDAIFRLSLVNPDRARKIKVSARFVAKDECPYNGYADVVAFSWGCGKSYRQLFREFGWVGPCLISDDGAVAKTFRRCLELVHADGVLPAEDWNTLVTCREVSSAGSLVGAILQAYGEESRGDLVKWRRYLDYVLSHLDSKAIRLSVLNPQIAWLKEYEPAEAELPPRLRLLWLTAQLAASNHEGGTTFGTKQCAQEFKELSERLKDEDAPLVCFAALHLAVEKTDCYQFEAAREILLPWEEEPAAVPGLRYHAQVLSSLGQHAAFLGENEKALGYFNRAMAAFCRLSEDWQRDFDQTSAYAVIAAMDCASPRLKPFMAMYLYGGEWSVDNMVDMAQQFAAVGEDEPDSKYGHAILLRYLVTLPESDPIRAAYVAEKSKWKWCADGHPWELIAFYRALLLPDGDPMRREWLKRGYELCLGSGPTLQAIASVIGAARLPSGELSGSEYLAKVEEVAAALPDIGTERIATLRNQLSKPIPPLELARNILPFNFR